MPCPLPEKETGNIHIHDLIIIGGGPGGLTAGIYAQRAALDTLLLEKGLPGGQMNNTDMVENWPGIESISGAELSTAMADHVRSYGLEIQQQEVRQIEPCLGHHLVHLADDRKLAAYALIIAAGGSPRKLGVPGEDANYGKGVSYCAVCDGFFFRNKTVVVVGGGDSALEEALYLAKIAAKVYLVHRREEFRGGMILQKRVKAEKNIELHLNAVVTAIQSDRQGVTGVALEDTTSGEQRELACDGVFIFIGFMPDNSLVPAGTKMNADGFVVTDEKCETRLPGIFVVGDLREKYVKQIITAAADGCIAAQAAARHVENRKGDGQ
ncbi:thioredoxin-disulfide reductase [Desulfurivibrio dismutans]|uniref:thioredoxin-disulfide reductase n=1 Tax=Desulfurivibrio dismutans TaxID=1398908 RepID=UPI0023DA9E0A|nr:thioredoxin-disulfide reductase [Desulfurivibrio alkaliphilus]MDF1614143.1 thioredoxin-disulfide reductase [Desulfurivibrio alkaliphilus]